LPGCLCSFDSLGLLEFVDGGYYVSLSQQNFPGDIAGHNPLGVRSIIGHSPGHKTIGPFLDLFFCGLTRLSHATS